jgi:hypothetical protein
MAAGGILWKNIGSVHKLYPGECKKYETEIKSALNNLNAKRSGHISKRETKGESLAARGSISAIQLVERTRGPIAMGIESSNLALSNFL